MFSDLKYALRLMLKEPAFSLTAAFSLALGIGLVATQFSLIDGILLRGLPLPEAGQLYHLARQAPHQTSLDAWEVVPHRDYLQLRERQTVAEGIGAAQWLGINLSGPDRVPSRHTGSVASANLLQLLRTQPMLGRWFTEEETRPGQPLFVVLSHSLWQEEFGGLPNALGRTVNVNGEPATIIGIMPAKFSFPGYERLWINLRPAPVDPRERPIDRVELFARLKPGVEPEQALAEFNTIAGSLVKLWPETNQGFERMNLQRFARAYSGNGTQPLLFLMLAMTVFILILACVNVANMLLGRASRRTRELAVRTAVGASRPRLIRQLLMESVLLAGAGCVGGLLVAQYGVDFLQEYLVNQHAVPDWMDFRLDHRVVAVAAGCTLAAGVLAGILPAWRASQVDPNTALKDDSRAAGSVGLGRIARWLIVAQIAFSTMLLVSAGVMSLTVFETRQANLRYDPDKLLTGRIELQEATQPTPEARARFYRRLLDRLSAEPGVETVAVTSRNFIGSGVPTQVAPEGTVYAHENDRPLVWLEVVSNDYFRLISATVLAGRLFDSREQRTDTGYSAVVNESLARKFWPGQDPLGRRFRTNQTKDESVTVVGVVPDLQMQGIFSVRGTNEAGFYLAQDQMGWGWLDIFIRTKGDPLALVPAVRKAIAGIDPNQPIHSIGTLTSQTAQAMRGFSIVGLMALTFAAISLFLGALGVYGVTSQAVSQRTREFGIRLALGSTASGLVQLVLRQGGGHIGLGLGIGLAGGFLLTLPMANIFGGNVSNQPGIYLLVVSIIAIVGLVALWLPARRATRVDPLTALRAE